MMANANSVKEVNAHKNSVPFLTFKLHNANFGIDLWRVQEIIKKQSLALAPETPNFMRSFIYLRKSIVPLMDLRPCFGQEGPKDSEKTSIIIVHIESGNSLSTIGIIVDEVCEMFYLARKKITTLLAPGIENKNSPIIGSVKIEDALCSILDLNRIVRFQGLQFVAGVARAQNKPLTISRRIH